MKKPITGRKERIAAIHVWESLILIRYFFRVFFCQFSFESKDTSMLSSTSILSVLNVAFSTHCVHTGQHFNSVVPMHYS